MNSGCLPSGIEAAVFRLRESAWQASSQDVQKSLGLESLPCEREGDAVVQFISGYTNLC